MAERGILKRLKRMVVVALLETLGALGNNIVAYDLIYVSCLDDNQDVKKAVRRAFDNLKF